MIIDPLFQGELCLILKNHLPLNREELESSYTYRLLKTWAEIDLTALRSNIRHIREKTHSDIRIMAVVKCNAYGHGVMEVSREALDLSVDALGVSSLFEGIELREEFPHIPIVVLSAITNIQSAEFLRYDISPVVCSWETVTSLAEAAKKSGTPAKIHIIIDTGMGRVGVWHTQAEEFIRKAFQNPHIRIEGVCSHFATSDEEDLTFSRKQLEWFNAMLEKIRDIPIPFKHISNTAGIFNLPCSHFNMIRPGASIYGIRPSEFINGFNPIKPVLSLKSRITFIKKIPPGRTLSYGRTYKTRKEMTVATLPVGYGDGYPRFLSNKGHVLIRGRKAGILGTVTMDQILVDITNIPEARMNDMAVLIGKQEKEEITSHDIARIGDTISYNILTGINKRVQRVYLS